MTFLMGHSIMCGKERITVKKPVLSRTFAFLSLVWCLVAGVTALLGVSALVLDFFKKSEE